MKSTKRSFRRAANLLGIKNSTAGSPLSSGKQSKRSSFVDLDNSTSSAPGRLFASEEEREEEKDGTPPAFPVVRKGHLLKSSEKRSWKEKYFSLSGLYLRYRRRAQVLGTSLLKPDRSSDSGYGNKYKPRFQWAKYEMPLKGAVLTSVDEVEVATSDAGDRELRYCFVLESVSAQNQPIKWILAAESEYEKQEWIAALSCNIEAANASALDAEFYQKETLAKKMAAEIEIKTRHFHLRAYPRTFLGEDAVVWLAMNQDCSEEKALKMGEELFQYGFFYHVVHEHGFSSGYLFYRFSMEICETIRNWSDMDASTTPDDIEEVGGLFNSSALAQRDLQQMKLACSALEHSVNALEEDLHCTKEGASAAISQLSHRIKMLQICLIIVMGTTFLSYLFFEGISTWNTLMTFTIGFFTALLLHCYGIPFQKIWALDDTNLDSNPFHHHLSRVSSENPSPQPTATVQRQIKDSRESHMYDNPVQEDEDLKSLPPVQEWRTRPVFVRMSPWVKNQKRLDGKPILEPLPINADDAVVPFENDLFRGRALLRLANMPDSPVDYFGHRSRLFQVAVQGEFKQRVCASKVMTGQSYRKPFKDLPAHWLIRSAFTILRRLSPALKDDVLGARPQMLSPLISTSQVVMVEHQGMESPVSGDLEENTTLLGGLFAEGKVAAAVRKRFFAKPRNLQQYFFEPGLVYTFDFYQHMLDVTTLEINLGFRKFDISKFLNRQPVQAMAKLVDSEDFFWNIEIWHEKLVQ